MWLWTKACYPGDLFIRTTWLNKFALTIPIELHSRQGKCSITKHALVDSGANTSFIHWKLIQQFNMKKEKLWTPLLVWNADDSINVHGQIMHKVLLAMKTGSHQEVITFYVSDLGHDDLILGYTWLQKHSPLVDWRVPEVTFSDCPPYCALSISNKWVKVYAPKANFVAHAQQTPRTHYRSTTWKEIIPSWWTGSTFSTIQCFIKTPDASTIADDDEVFIAFPENNSDLTLRWTMQSTELAAAENLKQKECSIDEMVPEQYQTYWKVFKEAESRELPPF